jgi:hypothetical protein
MRVKFRINNQGLYVDMDCECYASKLTAIGSKLEDSFPVCTSGQSLDTAPAEPLLHLLPKTSPLLTLSL